MLWFKFLFCNINCLNQKLIELLIYPYHYVNWKHLWYCPQHLYRQNRWHGLLFGDFIGVQYHQMTFKMYASSIGISVDANLNRCSDFLYALNRLTMQMGFSCHIWSICCRHLLQVLIFFLGFIGSDIACNNISMPLKYLPYFMPE